MSSEWQQRPLRDVLKIQNGYAFDSKGFSVSEGIPLIRIRDLKGGSGTETRFAGEYDDRYLVSDGDLLVGMDGAFGCYQWDGGSALLNQRVCKLHDFDSGLSPRFLFYSLNQYLKAIEDVTDFTTVKHLSSKQILGIEFPLPPLDEQQRIVGILDEAFDAIATAKANAERNLANARALFERYLETAFRPGSEGWKEVRLGDLATLRNGINFTKSGKGETVRIVGVKDFQSNYWVPVESLESVVTDGTLPDSDLLRENDVLFVRSNGNVNLIGRCLLAGHVEGRITHSGFTIRARLDPGIRPKYVCHYLRSQTARSKMISGGIGTNIKSLNQGTLSSLSIPLPSSGEQSRIEDKIEQVGRETAKLESIYTRKLAALDELEQSLLHQAFAGEL